MRFAYALILLAIFAMGLGYEAQAATTGTGLLETLTSLNRIKPLQHPDFEKAAEILDRRVLDNKNKVLGEVRDVILNNNGNITLLNVEFDRLNLSQPVFINYSATDAEPVSRGYALGLVSADVENMYPTLLADVETASGGGEDTYALSRLTGTEVLAPDGQRIGRITDVLFGANGDRAEAFYITMESGKARGKGIAVPYDLPKITSEGDRFKANVTQEQADAIIKFAQDLK